MDEIDHFLLELSLVFLFLFFLTFLAIFESALHRLTRFDLKLLHNHQRSKKNGVLYLFLMKSKDGVVHIHRVNSNGAIGPMIKSHDWSKGWTTARFFEAGGRTYLLIIKAWHGGA